MTNQPTSASEMSCANCPMRKRSEANPKAFLSRLWRWHTTWCPGWKAYQTTLAAESAGKPKS
jgi:hypothetical protein